MEVKKTENVSKNQGCNYLVRAHMSPSPDPVQPVIGVCVCLGMCGEECKQMCRRVQTLGIFFLVGDSLEMNIFRFFFFCFAQGMTALHWTCFHNRPRHMEVLLSKAADVTLHDIDGKTALHWAAQVTNLLLCIVFHYRNT